MSEFKKWFAARARNPDRITLEEAFAAGARSQPAPSVPVAALRPVIDWLRNGCDPQEAAKELEILIAAAPEAK